MATAKPFPTNLVPLGKLAPSAGSPVSLTSNYTDLGNEVFAGIFLQASAANTGNVYILATKAAADKTNYTNVLQILAAGDSFTVTSRAQNTMTPSQFYVDVDSTGAFAVGWVGQL
jgi:hypothetical protein